MESKDIKHGKYTWIYEKADLEQGGYYVCDPERNKVATIFPHNRDLPIEAKENASLYTRRYRSEEWEYIGSFEIDEAMHKGEKHIDQYRHMYHIVNRIKDKGLGRGRGERERE